MKKFYVLFCLSVLLISCQNSKPALNEQSSQHSKLRFTKNDNQWILLKDDKPYYIKGAHGTTKMEWVKELGGNSIIAYHYQVTDSLMNRALELGLTVSVILDIEKPRFGADYSDKTFVTKQRAWIKTLVEKYKDHPSMLFWIIGNEAHLLRRNNIRLWREINNISKMIHEIDSNHLTTTTIASYPAAKSYQPLQFKLFAPDVDFLSLTIYEFAHRIKRETRNIVWGWNGPYMVTEWSGDPHWVLPTTEWGAVIQNSSTINSKKFVHQYHIIFERDKEKCFGGYVFYWGQKQERTHTVFSLIMDDKYRTEALESVGYCWSGIEPDNWCPRIDSFYFDNFKNNNNIYLNIHKDYSFTIKARDPKNEPLKMKWEILEEGDYSEKWGGELENAPKRISGTDSLISFSNSIAFKTPDKEGAYRLFLYVYDMSNNIATVNQPFYTLP